MKQQSIEIGLRVHNLVMDIMSNFFFFFFASTSPIVEQSRVEGKLRILCSLARNNNVSGNF